MFARCFSLLFVVLFFVSCGPSKLELALQEVTRLDEMRQKTDEIKNAQLQAIELERLKEQTWMNAMEDSALAIAKRIGVTKSNVKHWSTWHIREKERREIAATTHPTVVAWMAEQKRINQRKDQIERKISRYTMLIERSSNLSTEIHYRNLLIGVRRELIDLLADAMAQKDMAWKVEALIKYEVPKKRTDKIAQWEALLLQANTELKQHDERVAQERARIWKPRIDSLLMDLARTQTAYDSINAMHTRAVVELSKLKRKEP